MMRKVGTEATGHLARTRATIGALPSSNKSANRCIEPGLMDGRPAQAASGDSGAARRADVRPETPKLAEIPRIRPRSRRCDQAAPQAGNNYQEVQATSGRVPALARDSC